MGFCLKLNKIITLLIVGLAGLWFLLVVVLPESGHVLAGPREKEMPITWRKVDGPSHSYPFPYPDPNSMELIEIVNLNIPNVFGAEAILLIAHEWSHLDYSPLLHSLSSLKMLGDRYRLPIYLIKQKSRQNLYNYRTVINQAKAVMQLIDRCVDVHNLLRLTVVAYEESALITLLALSEAEATSLIKLDKLIVVNPFNPAHRLYQNDPRSIARAIKRGILSDPRRTLVFHRLRILLINTFRTVHPEQPDSRDYFNFVFEDEQGSKYQLNSTLSLSSKSLWGINAYLPSYFTSKPFIGLLIRVIVQDQRGRLSLQSMEYILRYRDQSEAQRTRDPAKCRLYFLEELQRSKGELSPGCSRIVHRQRHKYRQSALVFYSEGEFQLFGERMEAIPFSDYQGGRYHSTLITNIEGTTQILLVGELPVTVLITLVRSPHHYPFEVSPDGQEGLLVGEETVVIESCEGWRPVIGAQLNENLKELVQWQQGNCYIQLQDYHTYSQWFIYNWNAVRNLIIFSLFSTHVLGTYTHSRYYTCLMVNQLLLLWLLGRLYLFENMIVTSAVTVVELLAVAFGRVSEWLYHSNNYYKVLVLLPLAGDFCGLYSFSLFSFTPSFSKLLWMQLMFASPCTAYLVSLLKFYFMLDIYTTSQPCFESIVLLSAWQVCQLPSSPLRSAGGLAQAKRRLADLLFLFLLCMCLGQQAGVIHQLINFYMITHLLLGAGEAVNLLLQSSS